MKASKPSKSFVQTLVNKKISPFGIASAILVIFLIGWLAMRLFNQSPAVEELTSFDHAHTAQSKVSPDSEIVTGGNSNDEETAVKVLEYFNQAAKFYQQKKYGKAIEAYTKAIELTPTDYSIYNNRGLVFHTMRDYDRAIADFDKSIEISPNSLTYNNRGVAREDRGDIEQAISDYRKALELDSSNEMANRNLNKILKRR
jgi:tetratricopeptide (TPR) repeat protein